MTERVSATRRDLVRLRLGLLGLTVVVLALSVWSFAATQSVLGTVRNQTAPAVLDVASARAALMQAHSAAVSSFVHQGAQLVGPGEQYTTDLAVAQQDLARAAGDNAAGPTGSAELQLIAGLLATYSDWMSQAGAHYPDPLYQTDLWYAARSLYGDDQTLAHLNTLADSQRQELDRQLSEGWLNPLTVLTWALPSLALLALLGYTQRYLWRKFGRRFNPGLLGATVLLLALMAATSTGLVLAGRAHAATAALTTYVTSSDRQSDAVSANAQHDLIELVNLGCSGGCGATVPKTPPSEALTTAAPSPAAAAAASAEFDAATDLDWLLVVIPVLALGIAALALVGLQPRIDEYRYRS